MREQLNAMTRGNDEADAAADAGLLAGGHMVNVQSVFGDPFLKLVEIGIVQHLESHQVEASRIGATQDERVVVEFVRSLEINATVRFLGDLMHADAPSVMLDSSWHVELSELDEARTQYA
jgi:hypothetical protein